MCVIIIKQKQNKISKAILQSASTMNPHGLGIMWLDTMDITYHKSKEWDTLDTDRPFIAHFRYATVGKVGVSNTHPFQCGASSDEWLMMNGTIRGLGNADVCDSKVLANQLGDTPRNTWKSQLEKHVCRFVTINKKMRTYQMYNKAMWTLHDGVWYSKDNVIQTNRVAVYGTLKRGYSNYNYYLTDSTYVGSGVTEDKYPLIIKGLPYMIEQKGIGYNVNVDVFSVSDEVLQDLDRLEGHPTWYRRKLVNILVNRERVSCWLYFNIMQDITANDTLHKTYKQVAYKQSPKQFELIREEMEFNVEDECPMCIACYGDLVSDGFDHFDCDWCGERYTANEVMQFTL